MGILDTIKDLFRVDDLDDDISDRKVEEKKKEIEEVNLDREELKEIDISKIKEKLDIRKNEVDEIARKEREAMHNAIATFLEDLDRDIKKLEEVDISLKKGDDRLRQASETGRKEYISQVAKLLEFLEDRKRNVSEIKQYLERFFQHSGKSYERTTLLIGKEIEGIVSAISGIGKIVDKYKIDNIDLISKERKINDALEKFDERENIERQKDEASNEMKEAKKKIDDLKNDLKEIEEKIEQIESGEEYKEKKSLLDEKKEIESEIGNVGLVIEQLIDERVFRKYVYLDKETETAKLADKYLENPVDALIKDEDLKIQNVYEDIKEKINFGIISLKEPGKMVFKLNVPEETLIENREKITKLKDELESLNRRVSELTEKLPDISHLEKDKENVMEKININEKNIVVLKDRVEKSNDKIQELNKELSLFVES